MVAKIGVETAENGPSEVDGSSGPFILRAAEVPDAGEFELLHDADLPDHVDLLVLGEVDALQVRGRGIRRRVDLL